jgi:hypothetical protein
MRKLNNLFLLFLLATLTPCLLAQEDPGSVLMSQAQRNALLEKVSGLLDEFYVFPDVAGEMSRLVSKQNENGDYSSLDNLVDFTGQLTTDLQSISHDRHLYVYPAPPDAGQMEDGRDNSADRLELDVSEAAAGNFGFRKVEILPGNIGYIDLREFTDARQGGPTAVAAMNFVAYTQALIFDLRLNSGGEPSMIQLISSYLFDEPKHLNSFYIRNGDRTEQYWTQASVPGKKMPDSPVYVLTSADTFSAAEEFTYNLKNMKRATVVGETTGGGAHPVEMHFIDLGDGVAAMVSMPYGRAVNPITGTNWEGTGVTPDIESPAGQALETAQLDILNKLVMSAQNDQQRFSAEWVRDELAFKLGVGRPESWSAEEFVGQYGPRRIFLDGNDLYHQRGNGPARPIEPMNGTDRFHVGELDYFRLQFMRDGSGQVTGLIGQYDDGRVDQNRKSSR